MTKRLALLLVLLASSSWFCCSRVTWTSCVLTVVIDGMRESPTGAQDARRILSSIPGITSVKISTRRGTAVCRGTMALSLTEVRGAFHKP